ncbi:MAG: CRTAC1 family protein [Planctomycetota bacterium]|nr:CRTAC1 family protein [Planctomycetota bacterium]
MFTNRSALLFTALLSGVILLTACGGNDADNGSEHTNPSTPEPAIEAPSAISPQKPEFMRIADQLYGGVNRYLGQAQVDLLREGLKRTELTEDQRLNWWRNLVMRLLEAGRVEEAVAEAENLLQFVEDSPDLPNMGNLYRLRGLAYLRQAEIQNCVVRHNRECCIFPLSGGGLHTVRAPAEKARADFERLLQSNPDDLKGRWLYNIVMMALGEYPHNVPEKHRLPPEAFASEHDVGRFADIAPTLGLDSLDMCGGVIVEDFDGDGWLDVMSSTYDPKGSLKFFHNNGDGTFEDRAEASHANDQFGGLNIVAADYDNDGDPDVLVLRGAWLFDDGRIRNSLLRNNDDGTFTDVTRQAGLALPAQPTQVAVWADFDNDGDLDVYIGAESRVQFRTRPASYLGQLYRNNGDGTFTDIAPQAGVTNDRYCKGAAAGDFDNDGDVDLYLSNLGPNRMYRNNGDGTFSDIATDLGMTEPSRRSFATWFFDYNNDGWLDLLVVSYEGGVADLASEALGRPHTGARPRLYHNNGDGTFTDKAVELGLNHMYLPMGANFGDLDNDGWLDIYLTTGDPDYQSLMPNVMLRNNAGRRFQNVTTSGGFGHLQKGHGIAFADLDHDGDQDIYHQLGGFFPGDKYHNALFVNPGHGNHFLTIDLVGVRSNRWGYGARIKLVVDTPAGQREIHRAVGSVSSFGGSPHRQEIGLGDATGINAVEIYWPASDTRQVFKDVAMDRMMRVTEGGEAAYSPLRPNQQDWRWE